MGTKTRANEGVTAAEGLPRLDTDDAGGGGAAPERRSLKSRCRNGTGVLLWETRPFALTPAKAKPRASKQIFFSSCTKAKLLPGRNFVRQQHSFPCSRMQRSLPELIILAASCDVRVFLKVKYESILNLNHKKNIYSYESVQGVTSPTLTPLCFKYPISLTPPHHCHSRIPDDKELKGNPIDARGISCLGSIFCPEDRDYQAVFRGRRGPRG